MEKKKRTNNSSIEIDFENKEVIDITTMENLKNTLHIEYLKEEYLSTPIPKELKSKVKNSIQKGKKDSMKKQIVKCTKIGGATLAAAMLSITILANTNPTISYAMEGIPILGSIIKVVTFRTYTDKTKDFEANIDIPKIEIDGSNAIQQAVSEVNKSVEDYTNELIAQYESDMTASNGEGNYAMDTSYKVINDSDTIFTLRIDTTVAMGGSNSFSKFYHINKETGVVFELKDVFKNDSDYIQLISDNIKEQMVQQMENDENLTYFYNNEETEEWNFKEIKPDQNFYFNDNGELVIVFDKYEVAPGYLGEVEFTIPQSVTVGAMILAIK